jgi:hypothetical protein
MLEIFQPTFLILKNKRRLMRSSCFLCVYVSRPLNSDSRSCPVYITSGLRVDKTSSPTDGRIALYAIRVVSKGSRRIILPRTSFPFINCAIWALRNTGHLPQERCSNLIRFPLRKSQANLKERLDASGEQLNKKDYSFHMHDLVIC